MYIRVAGRHVQNDSDTTREVITVTSNTGKYLPTYGDLFPYVRRSGDASHRGFARYNDQLVFCSNVYIRCTLLTS